MDAEAWCGVLIIVVVLAVAGWQQYSYHKDEDAFYAASDRFLDRVEAWVKRLLGR